MAATPSNVVSTFQRSLDAFKTKAGLSPEELKDFQLTSIDDLRRQIATIQNDQRKSKKMRYLKRLGPFLDTMEQYGKIVEVFLNLSEVVAFIWVCMQRRYIRIPLIGCIGTHEISPHGSKELRRRFQRFA